MELKEFIEQSLEDSGQAVLRALDGLTPQELSWRPGEESNSIGFILWHMTRVEDFFIQRLAQKAPELYETQGWATKWGTEARDSGGGYTLEQVNSFVVPPLEELVGYREAVRGSTLEYLRQLSPQGLDELPRPDRSPDSLGRVLRRMILELSLHAGQVAYLRGMQRGLNK